MRKFAAAVAAALLAMVGVLSTTAPVNTVDPGHRAYGALYVAESLTTPWLMGDLPRYVSHVSGVGRVSVDQLVLRMEGGKPDDEGYFTVGGTYSATGTIETVAGPTLRIEITNGTFELTESFFLDEDTGKKIPGIAFGDADVTLSDGTGKLAGRSGTGTILEGFMCQYYRWASFAFDVDLDIS